MLENSDL